MTKGAEVKVHRISLVSLEIFYKSRNGSLVAFKFGVENEAALSSNYAAISDFVQHWRFTIK